MRPVKEKRERALGTKLFLKADRCNSPKCVTVRRPSRPGQHGSKRIQVSEYGKQLQEKQKIQIYYGLNNRQMQQLFKEPREKVILKLQHRLDQIVFLLGLARSPRVAHQFVSHGHIHVNGRKVTIPSYHVKIGDVITIRPESRGDKNFEDLSMRLKQYTPPSWLKISPEEAKGECVALVTSSEETRFPFDITVVGQFYAR